MRNAVAASTTALLVIAQLAFAPAAQAATATVGNQLTTVDLTSPSLSALNLAQALVGHWLVGVCGACGVYVDVQRDG